MQEEENGGEVGLFGSCSAVGVKRLRSWAAGEHSGSGFRAERGKGGYRRSDAGSSGSLDDAGPFRDSGGFGHAGRARDAEALDDADAGPLGDCGCFCHTGAYGVSNALRNAKPHSPRGA